jgi:hypothetical protein
VILCAILLSALSLSASAQSQGILYLHASYLLDENAPTATTADALKLATTGYYVWKTAPFSAEQSFPSGAWTVIVWMNVTQQPTQYRLRLGIVTVSGGFVERAYSFTPTITSPSPARYEVTFSVGRLSVPARESLAIGFLRLWQNDTYSPAAFIFFDSQAMPSSLRSPSVTTTQQATTTQQTSSTTTTQQATSATTTQQSTSATTTQQATSATTTQQTIATTLLELDAGLGFAVVLMGIGVVVASAAGAVTVTLAGRRYPQVFTYAGYYYCGKHLVPLYSVNGWSWCPVERRYLTRLCRSCGSSMRENDRFCDRCGRAVR